MRGGEKANIRQCDLAQIDFYCPKALRKEFLNITAENRLGKYNADSKLKSVPPVNKDASNRARNEPWLNDKTAKKIMPIMTEDNAT